MSCFCDNDFDCHSPRGSCEHKPQRSRCNCADGYSGRYCEGEYALNDLLYDYIIICALVTNTYLLGGRENKIIISDPS